MTNKLEIIITPNTNGTYSVIPYYLDTYNDIPLTFNYQVADIKDISTRKSSLSLTITVPETANNRYVFQQISALDVHSTFNPNLNTKCTVLVDSIPQMEGYLNLNNINYDFANKIVEYDCTIIANNGSFWVDIGEGFLQELNLTRFDHIWNYHNIVNSWTQSYTNGYVYPLIDYDNDWTLNFIEGGMTMSFIQSALVNGIVPVGTIAATAISQVLISDMFPAVYVKTVWDEIFNESGYQYQSNFINTTYFEHLILPFSNGNLTNYATSAAGFTWSIAINNEYFGAGPFLIQQLDWNIINDPTGFWGGGVVGATYTNVEPIPFPQTFEFDISVSMFQDINGNMGDLQLYFWRQLDYPGGQVDPGWNNPGPYGAPLNLFANGTQNFIDISGIINVNYGGGPGYFTFKYPGYAGIGTNGNVCPPLNPGEQFIITAYNQQGQGGGDYTFSCTASVSVPIGTNFSFTVIPGENFILSQTLPANFKKKDFIMSMVRMFNLYIEPVKGIPNTLRIEPRDDYYANGSVLNWTDKLDLSQPYTNQPISNVQDRVTLLAYIQDNDYYNEDFFTRTHQIYGQYKYITDNQFSTSEGQITTQFAPTPITEIYDIQGYFATQSQYILPRIGKYTNQANESGAFSRTTVKPRITFFNYFTFKNPVNPTNIISSSAGDFFLLQSDLIYGSTPSQWFALPYTGHFDNPYKPRFDLNFGYGNNISTDPSIGLYYPLTLQNWTNQNLYNQFYTNMLNQINDPDARLLTVELYLNPEDIRSFYFNSIIYLEVQGVGQYYTVNSITNYDPTQIKTSTVELLKLNTLPQEVNNMSNYSGTGFKLRAGKQISNGSNGNLGGNYVINNGIFNIQLGNNTTINGNQNNISSNKSSIVGDGNIVSSKSPNGSDSHSNNINGDVNWIRFGNSNFISGNQNLLAQNNNASWIHGKNNYLGITTSNIFIAGDFNTVSSTHSAHGITIFGDNIIATQSSTIYINQEVIFGPSASSAGTPNTMAYFNERGTLGGIFTVLEAPTYSFAEGLNTQAINLGDHAEGFLSIASGTFSHAGGERALSSSWGEWSRSSNTTATPTGSIQYGILSFLNPGIAPTTTGTLTLDGAVQSFFPDTGTAYLFEMKVLTNYQGVAPSNAAFTFPTFIFTLENDAGTIALIDNTGTFQTTITQTLVGPGGGLPVVSVSVAGNVFTLTVQNNSGAFTLGAMARLDYVKVGLAL